MIKIFGIGLNKTGTKTLAKCLDVLGCGKHVSCRGDLLAKFREGSLNEIFSVIDQNNTFEDWPWPLMYRELFFRYGDSARYILTKRSSANVWLESLKRHSLRTPVNKHCRFLAYGFNYPNGRERYHLDFYERHNLEIREFFSHHNAEHLLLELSFDSGDDWEKLCTFLDKPVPNSSFPHENKGSVSLSEEIERQNRIRIHEQLSLLWKL